MTLLALACLAVLIVATLCLGGIFNELREAKDSAAKAREATLTLQAQQLALWTQVVEAQNAAAKAFTSLAVANLNVIGLAGVGEKRH